MLNETHTHERRAQVFLNNTERLIFTFVDIRCPILFLLIYV